MPDDPYRYFRLEAREILDQFGSGVLSLEKGGAAGGADEVKRLLRLAHTLKGAARVVKQVEIADSAHAIEDALQPFRDTAGPVTRDSVDAVLAQLDAIAGRVRALDAPAPPPPQTRPPQTRPPQTRPPQTPATAAAGAAAMAPPAASAPVATTIATVDASPVDATTRTVRAEIAEVDRLLEGIAETHILLGSLRTTQDAIAEARRLADAVTEQRDAGQEDAAAPAPTAVTTTLAADLQRSIATMERRFGTTVDQIERELRQLRDSAEQLRLVGAATLFTALERTARDTARALGKDVSFEARGGDVRMDADVLIVVQGALVQLVRNAVAHGIELPAARTAAGKPAAGRVTLDVERRGNQIAFICRDDGHGVDLDAVRRAAQRRGVNPAEARDGASAQELINLLLRGGISTSDAVTEIAGRGIGLDIVREAMARLGGRVAVHSDAGKGASFELAVPLSLMSVMALIVEAAGIGAALPLDAVEETLLLDAQAVSHEAAGTTIVYEGRAIPFLWLPNILGRRRLPSQRHWPTVIVSVAGKTAGIGIDRLLGTGRAVVHPLPALAPTTPLVAGALLDAEGTPQLVLHAEGLVAEAERHGAAEPEREATRHNVLIVDDSLTTRMLEQSILEAAGYEVDLAESAERAMEIARDKRYALFLVDVEMPGMDGYTFVERTRADPALHDIPAVLVTSRAAPEDKQRGRDAGARGYIVKSEFDQSQLLSLLRELIG